MNALNKNCPDCGLPMVNVGGLGHKGQLICNNTRCPSKHKHVNCPKCKSKNITVDNVLGFGHFQYKCNNCNHSWKKLLREE